MGQRGGIVNVVVERPELITIEQVEPLLSPNPDQAVRILGKGSDAVL